MTYAPTPPPGGYPPPPYGQPAPGAQPAYPAQQPPQQQQYAPPQQQQYAPPQQQQYAPPQQQQYAPPQQQGYAPQGGGYGAPQQVHAPQSVDTAKPGSGGGGEYLDSGVHEVLIKRCKLRVSENPKKVGHVIFIIEAVVEKTTPGPDAPRPNYASQEVAITADLNGFGAGDAKTWIAQIMGGNPTEVTSGHVDWVAGDVNPFGETRATVSSKINGKGTFTHHKFTVTQPGPALAALAQKR